MHKLEDLIKLGLINCHRLVFFEHDHLLPSMLIKSRHRKNNSFGILGFVNNLVISWEIQNALLTELSRNYNSRFCMHFEFVVLQHVRHRLVIGKGGCLICWLGGVSLEIQAYWNFWVACGVNLAVLGLVVGNICLLGKIKYALKSRRIDVQVVTGVWSKLHSIKHRIKRLEIFRSRNKNILRISITRLNLQILIKVVFAINKSDLRNIVLANRAGVNAFLLGCDLR